MKIITVLGSPRKKGNTATALKLFEDGMAEKGHETERVNLADVDVRPCISCWSCAKNTNAPGCPRKDDAPEVFCKIMDADAVIYATPLYCWGFSAQMKAFIDRHVCLVKGFETDAHKSFVAGKKAALLVTCEGPEEGNADLIQKLFDRMTGEYTLMNNVGKFIITGCGMKMGTLSENAPGIIDKMKESLSQ